MIYSKKIPLSNRMVFKPNILGIVYKANTLETTLEFSYYYNERLQNSYGLKLLCILNTQQKMVTFVLKIFNEIKIQTMAIVTTRSQFHLYL